jgi:hypothetical protein
MRYSEIINESLSKTVFHYTGISPALKVLTSGVFQLSSMLGSVEQQYAPKGYPYFLSTTRTRHGGYHEIIGSSGVLFVLDGNWFNQHYPSKPVDYWENRDPTKAHHRKHEAEDRVFSKDPTIPINGVTAIHVYTSTDADDLIKARARQTLIAAKRLGIETYFYTDKDAWKNFDKNKQANVSILTGQDTGKGYVSSHRGYLLPWMELLQATEKSQLSKNADKLRYSLMYSYDKDSAAKELANDLSNSRKPDSGPDRSHAVKIIKYMRDNKLENVSQFVDAISNKWKK